MIALTLAILLASDYALILPSGERNCATSAATCEAARTAIERGMAWPDGPGPGATTACVPQPGCRPARSLCILGYNC